MNKKTRKLLDRMARLINTSKKEQKEIVERYISLCNRELHKNKKDVWGIAGASAAIRRGFCDKFGGYFNVQCEAIKFLEGK